MLKYLDIKSWINPQVIVPVRLVTLVHLAQLVHAVHDVPIGVRQVPVPVLRHGRH